MTALARISHQVIRGLIRRHDCGGWSGFWAVPCRNDTRGRKTALGPLRRKDLRAETGTLPAVDILSNDAPAHPLFQPRGWRIRSDGFCRDVCAPGPPHPRRSGPPPSYVGHPLPRGERAGTLASAAVLVRSANNMSCSLIRFSISRRAHHRCSPLKMYKGR